MSLPHYFLMVVAVAAITVQKSESYHQRAFVKQESKSQRGIRKFLYFYAKPSDVFSCKNDGSICTGGRNAHSRGSVRPPASDRKACRKAESLSNPLYRCFGAVDTPDAPDALFCCFPHIKRYQHVLKCN